MTVAVGPYAWVSLWVRDLEGSVDWYSQRLGLVPFLSNADTCALDDPERFTYLLHPESLLMVGLHRDPTGAPRGGGGLHHLALTVAPDDLERCRDAHCRAGADPTPVVPWRAGSWFEVRDLDDHAVRLFAWNKGNP